MAYGVNTVSMSEIAPCKGCSSTRDYQTSSRNQAKLGLIPLEHVFPLDYFLWFSWKRLLSNENLPTYYYIGLHYKLPNALNFQCDVPLFCS